MSLNSYLTFFLKSEVISYEREAYQRDVLHHIPRKDWEKYMAIMKCSCECPGQDELYGTGMRVKNKMTKSESFKCTSCGSEARADGVALKGKKK